MLILYNALHREGCTASPIVFKACTINDLIVEEVEVEAAKQRGTVGEDTVSGLMFADEFVAMSETPEGLQKQIIEEALQHTH